MEQLQDYFKVGIFDTKSECWVTSFISVGSKSCMGLQAEPFEWKGKESPHNLVNIFGEGQLVVKPIK